MELAPGIHQIEGVRGANSFLAIVGDGAAVIDTGMPGNEKKIVGYCKEVGVEPGRLLYILLTHPDIDHSGSVAALRGLTGAKVAIHEADAPRLSGQKSLKEAKGAMRLVFGLMTPLMRFTPAQPNVLLKDSDRILDLEVVHTPGHTDGSVCFLRDGVALFVGDALRTDSEGRPALPPGAMTVDMDLAKKSIQRIAGLHYQLLLPGHGRPITEGASAAMEAFAKGLG